MKTSILFFSIIVLAQSIGFSQTLLPPVFEIKSDTAFSQNISTAYYQMLEDKGGKLTISDVTSLPLSHQFHDRNDKSSNRDALSNTYWFRYRLKNSMGREAKISLNSMSDYDDFYLAEPDGKWKHFVSGKLNDWVKKDGLRLSDCIPIVLQPSEECAVYQRIQNEKAGLVPYFGISTLGTEKIIIKEYKSYLNGKTNYFGKLEIQVTFLLGLLFLTILFNLFFFRFVREKVYLYFALFALFLAINRLDLVLSSFLHMEYPELQEYLYYLVLAWAFIPYFLIQFFRQFFQTKSKYPGWDKWLNSLAILNIVGTVIQFISMQYFINAIDFSQITGVSISLFFVPLSIIITLLLFVRSRDKSVWFVIIGSFPLMLNYLLGSTFYVAELLKISISKPQFAVMVNSWLVEFVCIIWFVLSFSWILFIRYDRLIKENAQHALDKERLAKEKEIEKNELIESQKTVLEQQVTERTADLRQSLEDLKSTQSQLIQSEKMASLGELTAGIAHEIQNPLNFVNNFSEVNTELIVELELERKKEIRDLEIEDDILKDIKENEQKINHHGKRADAIVKGMLQHTRSISGVKEPTDINALADEYLRLAYHGLRAKDKSFNATMKTDFDETIGKINIIPQDIGRVILNLITNAFYAVNEKMNLQTKDLTGFENLSGLNTYEPTVIITTSRSRSPGEGWGEVRRPQVSISVKDNGNGIPTKVLDKIFQPFFTTKPTGQGTGLGLSLAYDIVKAHGGEIKVESIEGEGTEFVVLIPLTT